MRLVFNPMSSWTKNLLAIGMAFALAVAPFLGSNVLEGSSDHHHARSTAVITADTTDYHSHQHASGVADIIDHDHVVPSGHESCPDNSLCCTCGFAVLPVISGVGAFVIRAVPSIGNQSAPLMLVVLPSPEPPRV